MPQACSITGCEQHDFCREMGVCAFQGVFLPGFTIAVNSREMFLPHWLALDLLYLIAVGTTISSAILRCSGWLSRDAGGPKGAAYLMFSWVSFSSSCSMCSCNSPGRRRTWQMGQIGAWLSNKVAFFLPVGRKRRKKALALISCRQHHLLSDLVLS